MEKLKTELRKLSVTALEEKVEQGFSIGECMQHLCTESELLAVYKEVISEKKE